MGGLQLQYATRVGRDMERVSGVSTHDGERDKGITLGRLTSVPSGHDFLVLYWRCVSFPWARRVVLAAPGAFKPIYKTSEESQQV